MANAYRRAASRRKLIYFGIIAGLFVVTIFARGVVALPLSGLKEKADKWTIRSQARELELTEYETEDQTSENPREAELTGSSVRLLLTGSRGFAVCVLWISAQEKQKRQEWNELDMTVRSITTLQPHFMQPWLFQSWNLAYNVSVEMDRLDDMYFYIGRGISVLAEGDAVNRNHPDLRYAIATYFQSKFTNSDKVTTLRSLLHLSCMPAEERNPERYLTRTQGKLVINEAEFQAFCEKYPQFIRRMRESPIRYGKTLVGGRQQDQIMYLAETPQQVIEFLRANQKLPSRYRKDDPRKLESRLRQFPVVPPLFTNGDKELKFNEDWRDGQANALLAARAWFSYANEAVPPPNPVPGPPQFDYRDPERKRRMPRQPMLIIFRQGPPRAQSYVAEQLTKEGWFDSSPWIVDEGLSNNDKPWFSKPVEIKPSATAQEAWLEAHTMWSNHGRDNGLNLTVEQFERYKDTAKLYAEKRYFPIPSSIMQTEVPAPRPDELEDANMKASINANIALSFYYRNRQLTNYETFLNQAFAEMDSLTVRARKLVHEADRNKLNADGKGAIRIYEQLLGTQTEIAHMHAGAGADDNRLIWARVLLKFKKFAATDRAQEETYEMQVRYLNLVQVNYQPEFKQMTMGLCALMAAASPLGDYAPYRATSTGWILSGRWEPTNDTTMRSVLIQDRRIHVPLLVFGTTATLQWSYQYLPAMAQGAKPFWPPGPFDGLNPETNQPWVSDGIKQHALSNAGMGNQPTAPNPPPAGGPMPRPISP